MKAVACPHGYWRIHLQKRQSPDGKPITTDGTFALPPPKAKYLQLGTAQRGRPPDVPEPVNMLRAIAVLTGEKEGDSDGR